MPDPIMCIPVQGPKVTASVWGPCDEYIITGHENGLLCKWDPKVTTYVLLLLKELPRNKPTAFCIYHLFLKAVLDTWPNIGGHAYCFYRMTSHISIVLEQKTIVFQDIGGS